MHGELGVTVIGRDNTAERVVTQKPRCLGEAALGVALFDREAILLPR